MTLSLSMFTALMKAVGCVWKIEKKVIEAERGEKKSNFLESCLSHQNHLVTKDSEWTLKKKEWHMIRVNRKFKTCLFANSQGCTLTIVNGRKRNGQIWSKTILIQQCSLSV